MMKKNNTGIRKIYRLRDILISGGIIAAGVALMLIIPDRNWTGITILIVGCCMAPFYRTGYKLDGKDGIFMHKALLLPLECKQEIVSFVEGTLEELNVKPMKKGGMLLEVYYLKNYSKICVQLFSYESYMYTPLCKLSEIQSQKLKQLEQLQ